MKIIFAKLIVIIQIALYSPLIFIIILLWPLLKIRIGCIKTKLLGSVATATEVFLCEKKAGIYKKNEIFLWFRQEKVSNEYLFKKRKEQLLFLPRFILLPITYFFYQFKFTHKHIYYQIKYNNKTKKFDLLDEKFRIDQKILKKIGPSIKFSQNEIQQGENYLKKNFINKDDKIILFGARTRFYRNEINSMRNSDIKLQIKSMKFVTDHGYKAIKMGKEKVSKLNVNSKKIFDYTFADYRSDFLDVFIGSKAKFMVCGDTGLSELVTIMRIPKTIVDFHQFNTMWELNEAYTPIILPKKILSVSTNKYLSYIQIFEKKFFNIKNHVIPEGYKCVDSTEDEILEATKEMIELTEHQSLDLDFERKKQVNFWNTHANLYGLKSGIIISPSFFKKNIELFK
tara:strand:- start:132 stop:1325 length:1194 start_codon:yes stop_codon:yes gene_type:complete